MAKAIMGHLPAVADRRLVDEVICLRSQVSRLREEIGQLRAALAAGADGRPDAVILAATVDDFDAVDAVNRARGLDEFDGADVREPTAALS